MAATAAGIAVAIVGIITEVEVVTTPFISLNLTFVFTY